MSESWFVEAKNKKWSTDVFQTGSDVLDRSKKS
jgi:hypothetical protein